MRSLRFVASLAFVLPLLDACSTKTPPSDVRVAPAVELAAPLSASTSAPAATPSATASARPDAAATATAEPLPAWNGTWPAPSECSSILEACTMPDGEPGTSCGKGAPCYNPCLKGMAPEETLYCAKRCKKDAECGAGGTCSARGVCDTSPKFACKDEDIESCNLPGGGTGFHCKGTKKCGPACKRGLVLTGGTHCAKPCKSNAQCPGGECVEGTCGPLCPSEGCPYLWE